MYNNKQHKENQRNLRDDDVFVASYPRSGNTWTRCLLSDLILQVLGFETDTKLPITPPQIIPNIYGEDITAIDSRIKIPCRLIKTHAPYNRISTSITRIFWRPRAIYLFRNPADSLSSYYHLQRLEGKISGEVVSRDSFCEKNMWEWCNNVKSYIIVKAKHPEKILFISYESMQNRPLVVLPKVMNFIGITVDEAMCAKAVENQSFEKKKKLAGNSEFYRKGKVGSSEEELSQKTLDLIEEKAMSVYNQAKDLELT